MSRDHLKSAVRDGRVVAEHSSRIKYNSLVSLQFLLSANYPHPILPSTIPAKHHHSKHMYALQSFSVHDLD